MNETDRGIEKAKQLGRYEAMLDTMSDIILRGQLDGYSQAYARKVRRELEANGVYSEYGFVARQYGDVQILETKDTGGR